MKTLNLNNYNVVPEGEATLKVVFFKTKDGTTPPEMFLVSKRAKPEVTIEDVNLKKVEWNSTLHVDVKCQASDYIALVNWWFDSANKDADFNKILQLKYGQLRDFEKQMDLLEAWLKDEGAYHTNTLGAWDKRTKDIKSFTFGWLGRNLKKQR